MGAVMRQATQEQQHAAAERRAKFRNLAKQLSAMPKAQREAIAAKLPAIATVEGRMLSPFNMCLVAAQFPAATVVGGFRQWLKAGRVVRKGEHGMCLWVPFMAKRGDAGAEQDQAEQAGEVKFGMGTVFDVSQTEPRETVQGAA